MVYSTILRLMIVALLAVTVVPTVASANNKMAAKEAYQSGTRLYDLGRFDEALAQFEKAYLSYEDGAFLYNIAQCYRRLSRKAEALQFYRTYLYKQPDSPNADQVRQL